MYDVFKLDYFGESYDKVFTEAVFVDGKERVKPIEEHFQKIKDLLEEEIKEKKDKFDPDKFWKNDEFKQLENSLSDIFGFRHVSIQPFREKYISKEDIFESRQLNACVYSMKRFPIDGLVTEKGFYDSTKSTVMDIYVTLGLIRTLSASEITAVLLHEFGHAIDPALTDISYTETNVLSKYLTDRETKLTTDEKKVVKHIESVIGIKPGVVSFFTNLVPLYAKSFMGDIFISKNKKEKKTLDKISKLMKNDKSKFDRVHASEAYADNYARMYGYGTQLAKALSKMDKDYSDKINSRYKKERMRCELILMITKNSLKDVHKTDIHRIRALIKEYHEDINDPNTSPAVKKQMEDDVKELELVLDEYMNNRGDFQNRVNQLINKELTEIEKKEAKSSEDKKEDAKKKDDVVKESAEVYESIKSEIDDNFQPKERIELSSLKMVQITPEIIDEYKTKYPHLKHVRCEDTNEYKCDGYMWFLDGNLVCNVGICEYLDNNDKWIVSLDVFEEYQGHGLSKQILDFVVELGCKYLSVNKNNKLAKKIYDDYGFETYKEDDHMYYMKLNK